MTGAALVVGAIMLVGALLKLGDQDSPAVVRKKLAKRTIARVSSLGDGDHGTTRGIVETLDGALLTSPLGQKPCVFWRIVIEEVGTGGDYAELGRREEGTPFLLRTDDGPARVVPEHPHIGLDPAEVIVRLQGTLGGAPDSLLAQMKKPNHPSSHIRVKEIRIEPGRQLTVSGYVAREQDPDAASDVAGYRAQLPTRPVFSGTRRVRLLLGD